MSTQLCKWQLEVTNGDQLKRIQVASCMSDYRRGLNWWLNLLATYRSYLQVTVTQGRAIAQAVSRWLPTAAARVQNRV
jgi:hypothetical protein